MHEAEHGGAAHSAAPRFHIHTLGCKVNQAESERIIAELGEHGWTTARPADADLCIVNTCTVTGEAETKNRKVIRQLLRACNGPVVVTGCAINIAPDHYRDLSERVVVECDKSKIAQTAEKSLRRGATCRARATADDSLHGDTTRRVRATDDDPLHGIATCRARTTADDSPRRGATRRAPTTAEASLRRGAIHRARTRASVKVQDGCDNACTYCIVHTARGPARSVAASSIIADVNARCDDAPELVLVGIDLAAYNDCGIDLAGLLRMLQDRTNVGRIRITSIEPQSFTNALIDELAASTGRVCRHLHLCLQSGSSKVLREMDRHYDADQFVALVDELRSRVPGIALSTDVIVGFPGETDEDFAQTCEVVRRCGFMKLHVFRYSKRPGTPAAARQDQVDPKVSAARAHELAALGEELAAADRAARVGTSEFVVVERPGTGTSESYHTVRFSEDLPIGALVKMQFTGVDEAAGALVGITC